MLPLKPFYMIRHGQTVANAARLAAGGQFDTPLNETGINQAKTLAPALKQLDIMPTAIFHSNMQRARDTANFLNAEYELPMTEEHSLREHDLGEWDNQAWDDVLPRLERHETPIGGESESQFATRIQTAISAILEHTAKDDLPMIVAHGGLFHAMGFLYEYGISPVQNCHLHYFEPHKEHALFPWIVWQFDLEGDTLVKSPAPFCSSQIKEAV